MLFVFFLNANRGWGRKKSERKQKDRKWGKKEKITRDKSKGRMISIVMQSHIHFVCCCCFFLVFFVWWGCLQLIYIELRRSQRERERAGRIFFARVSAISCCRIGKVNGPTAICKRGQRSDKNERYPWETNRLLLLLAIVRGRNWTRLNKLIRKMRPILHA